VRDAIDVAADGGGARAGRGGVTTEETMREYEYAAVLQGKILDKYGTLYGISKDLVNRVSAGTATPDELTTYSGSITA
jgi:hypothetical protein